MSLKPVLLAAFFVLAWPPLQHLASPVVTPAWAACDPGDKLDKTTLEETRQKVEKAGYTDGRDWRKGCDNVWHVTATKNGAQFHVAVLPDGHVVREGD